MNYKFHDFNVVDALEWLARKKDECGIKILDDTCTEVL